MSIPPSVLLNLGWRSLVNASAVYHSWLRLASLQFVLCDEALIHLAGQGPLPPAYLRSRVHGGIGLSDFLVTGQKCAADLNRALHSVGRDFSEFDNVLDFGCGCGRTLRWIRQAGVKGRVRGTDIDADAIAWCAQHLEWAECAQNGYRPPLSYPANEFDLIYAISVFTHLIPEYQDLWLRELQRVAKPGATLLLTLHGRHAWEHDTLRDSSVEHKGIHVENSAVWLGVFPEWYQNTYHAERYVHQHFSRYFEVLRYLPAALKDHQDIVVLRKRPAEGPELSIAGESTGSRERPVSV